MRCFRAVVRLIGRIVHVIGIDIGTSASKGVAVGDDGAIEAIAQINHEISRPRAGWAEHEASTWWSAIVALCRQLGDRLAAHPAAICVSGMGPCLAPATSDGRPLRPAILYGIDSRAEAEIKELASRFGNTELLRRGGSLLSSQAVGPKMLWLRRHEPDVWGRTQRFFMPSSFAVWQLTGEYVLDHHSASQCDPLYDLTTNRWNTDWIQEVAPGLEFPHLLWPGQVAGEVGKAASEATGIARGTPVLAGTIDAWAESVSVGATRTGDVMLMYGSTMFLTKVVRPGTRCERVWATAGIKSGTETLAAGMATGGIVASWFSDLVGQRLETLIAEAADVVPGAEGLLALPYFAGERTPIFDPRARGALLGLTISHGRPQIMRAFIEAVAFGVRHNLEAVDEVSPPAARFIAVGGGAQTSAWPQVVSDVNGIAQLVPRHTIGAALGDAMLAAEAIGITVTEAWNPIESTIEPNGLHADLYAELYALYREAYTNTREVTHRLVDASQRLP